MKSLAALLLISTIGCFAQDIRVREEAVTLLEKARLASSAPNWPNLQRTDTFRVFQPDGSVREGTFTRTVVQGTGRREEITFGDYHVVNIWTKTELATVRNRDVQPPDVRTLLRITPVYRVWFNQEDVIHEITDREINGRAARCIEFSTVAGEKTDNNEICVDSTNGTKVFEKLGPEVIESSDFFAFAGALIPGKIAYQYGGVRRMEITQTMTALDSNSANVLAAPPNAQIHSVCKTYRQPFGESMPQPKQGSGGSDTDIVIRGMVDGDGKLHDAVVQASERPDLDQEALNLAAQWQFSVAMCDGKPNRSEVSIVLHFQGR